MMQQPLWESGNGGYHTYRIPALVVTTNSTLLAFREGRKSGASDADYPGSIHHDGFSRDHGV